jgi:ribose-phosphate pyrophosphokinase
MMSTNITEHLIPDFVFSFADGWNQAQALASRCGATMGTCDVHRFPDGESLIAVEPAGSLAGKAVALYRSLNDPNEKLVEVMLAADAFRRCGAARLILIAPYLSYMRQDKVFTPGQSLSQEVVGHFLAAHFDVLITVEPHLHRTSSLRSIFAGKPALDIAAGKAIATHIKASCGPRTVIVGPDEESEPLIRDVAGALGVSWLVARKSRRGDQDVVLDLPIDSGLQGNPVVIVDDIISTGGTVMNLARALKRAGAGEIVVYAVHALFDQRAALQMERAGVSKIRSLSTVPHPTNAITVVDLIAVGLGVRL